MTPRLGVPTWLEAHDRNRGSNVIGPVHELKGGLGDEANAGIGSDVVLVLGR